MRPKKPKDELRVPLNCFIAPATMTAIVSTMKQDGIRSQGAVVDRAVALLAYGEEIERPLNTRGRKLEVLPNPDPAHVEPQSWSCGLSEHLKKP